MKPDDAQVEERVERLLALVDGPGWQGREARDRAIQEVRALDLDTALSLLAVKLKSPKWKERRQAVVALLFVDTTRAIDLVLPMLHDPESEVRWYTCGCLHDFGDERALEPLLAVLEGDPDPHMRGTAAYSLGGVGSPAAIPALLRALDSDHELDIHGHSASSSAARALARILGTYSGRDSAVQRYQEWAGTQAEHAALRNTAGKPVA